MKYRLIHILVLFFISTATSAESQGSNSIKAQYEIRDFENSKQKIDGINKTVDLEFNLDAHMFKAAYERTDTKTKAHIPKDLEVKKVFARMAIVLINSGKFMAATLPLTTTLCRLTAVRSIASVYNTLQRSRLVLT